MTVVTAQAAWALWRGWRFRATSHLGRLRLPVVRTGNAVEPGRVEALVRRIDRVVGACVSAGRHPCFYRAYARASILRRRGVPVVLNVGLRNLKPSLHPRGHCWLTLDGEPFLEPENVQRLYPVDMGQSASGVRFWAGAEDTDSMKRVRRREVSILNESRGTE